MGKGFGIKSNTTTPTLKNGGSDNTFIPVRVVDIVLDDSNVNWNKLGGWDALGVITFVPIFSDQKFNKRSEDIARPLFSNLKQYPLINEITYVIQLPDPNTASDVKHKSFYYLNTINLWNHPHHNLLPNIDYSILDKDLKLTYKEIEAGLNKTESSGSEEFEVGKTFKEKSGIKTLLPFEGDIIHEGRWGQSIRFGSTVKGKNDWSLEGKNGDPIIIIRNGQLINPGDKGWIPVLEDVNKDSTSMYFTDGQVIPIDVASKNLNSFGSTLKTENIPIISIADNPLPPPTPPLDETTEETEPAEPVTPPTPPIIPPPAKEIYDEEEISTDFHFPGEDTQEFNFDVDDVDEELSNMGVTKEVYNATIISSEGPQTKTGDLYIPYVGGKAQTPTTINYFERIRVIPKYLRYIKLLVDDANSEGIPLTINSGFRTWAEQLAKRKQNLKDKTKINDEDFLLNASSKEFLPETARPGRSNHQKGTTFDFNTATPGVYKWLVDNAVKYGFIRTVPGEKWHWEYRPQVEMFAIVKKDHPSWEGLTDLMDTTTINVTV